MAWTVPGYSVERMLGFGATGEVWAGRDLRSGERVALKRLRAGCTPADRDRLRREAALLAAFEHPHVVRLRGVRGTEDGLVLVLDLAEGGSFAGVLAGRGPLGAPEVGALCGPVAAALTAAHAAGLVHGDVSPGNLLLDSLGRPLLADLGTARLAGDTDAVAHGTAGYVDPAVLAGAAPTAASDVYGLAAVAAHLLTGRPPDPHRPADTAASDVYGRAAVATRLPTGRPPDPHRPADTAAGGLLADLAACLDPDPSRRPSAAGLGAVFEVAAAGVEAVTVPWAAEDGSVAETRRAGAVPVGADEGVESPAWTSVAGFAQTRALPRPAPPVPGGSWLLRAAKLPHWWCRAPAGGGGSWHRSGRTVRRWPRSAPLWPRCRPFRWRRGSSGSGQAPRWALPATLGVAVVMGTGALLLWPDSAGTSAVPVRAPEAAVWRQRVQGLDAARSAVFARADPARLRDVYEAGSPAAAADAARVAALASAGAIAPGVRHDVLGLRVVSATRRRARLELTDRMPGYRVLDRQGRVLRTVPPRAARTFRVDLVASPSGWRITVVRVVPPAPVSGRSPTGGLRPRPGGGT